MVMRGLVVAAGMVLTGGLVPAMPAHAAVAEVWAFAYADLPWDKSYDPEHQAASDEDIEVEVTREGAGRYEVTLENGAAAAGVPMVTAVGDDRVHCQVTSFGRDDEDEVIDVACYQGTARVDSAFTVSFFSSTGQDSLVGAYGYVFNDKPGEVKYTAPVSYRSTGGKVEIERDAATGVWTVHFFGEAFDNVAGNVQVTALGALPTRCAVVQWYRHDLGADAQVRCERLADPSVVPQWTLMYTHERSIVGNRDSFFGYLQADQPAAPLGIPYTPDWNRNRGPDGLMHKVTRTDTGQYQALVYGSVTQPVALHVSANRDTGNYCGLDNPMVMSGQEPGATVDIYCYTRTGAPTNSWFSLNYYSPNSP